MSSAELSTLICTIFICTTFLLLFSITTSNFIFTYIDTIITRESLKLYTLSNNIITKSSPPPPPPPPPSPPPPTPSPPLRPLSPPPPPFLYSSEPSPPLASLLQAQSLLSPLPGSLLSPPPLLSPPQPLLSPPPPLRKEDSNDSDLFRLPTNVNKLPSPSPEPSMPPQLSSLSPSFTQPPLTQPPPQLLEDDEDDKKLFHLASKVNSTPTHGAPQKLAFLFLTTSPLPFAPLWELYFLQNQTQHPNKNLFNIYIHADPSYPYNPPFSGIFSNRTISSSKPTQRGSPSLISAARRLLADALLHDPSNARFIIISTSCIPIHSFNFTYTTLFNTNKSFIEILKNEPKIFNRYISRGGVNQMLPEVPFDEFRVGSQFFVLNRHHARLIVKDEKVWSKFRLPCVKPKFCYPEEHYFSTLLNMEDSTSCIPATLTHVDWSLRLGSHPRTYKESDIGVDLIKSIRERKIRYGNGGVNGSEVEHHYPFLFARKFSPRCLKPLIGIANDFLY